MCCLVKRYLDSLLARLVKREIRVDEKIPGEDLAY